MTKVFISYSRKDLVFVEQLASDLTNSSLDVWYDLSKLGGGNRWNKEIENAIRHSQFVIVVLSPDSIESEWVEKEVIFASSLKRKIIPIFYRPCDLGLTFINLHYIDVQNGKYETNYEQILRALNTPKTESNPHPKNELSPTSELDIDWQKEFEKAVRYYKSGKLQSARYVFEHLAEIKPDDRVSEYLRKINAKTFTK